MPLPVLPGDAQPNSCACSVASSGERYFLSPRMKRLKNILAKIDPASVEPAATPFPAPLPSVVPSALYRRMKGVRRRR
jgi:hypothetical protein